MDQVLDNKLKIDNDMLNDVKDEVYVLGNIIKDDDKIGRLTNETKLKSGSYCFISTKKVILYLSQKINMSAEGRLEMKLREKGDLGVLNNWKLKTSNTSWF